MNRRDFLALAGAGAAGALAGRFPVMAGPFEEADYRTLIPEDKKLDPAWKASLFSRGKPAVYEGEALRTIGMPVGGITCGQVYLGGDGKLWLFDLFNRVEVGVCGKGSRGGNYVHPLEQAAPLAQGFFLRVRNGSGERIEALDRRGAWNIRFQGAYPVGRVTYRGEDLPLSVELEAFSPFCPLDTEDSSLPVTVMRFRVKNEGAAPLEAEVAGLLENAVCLHHDRPGLGVRRNRVGRGKGFTFMECSAAPPPPAPPEPVRPEIVFENFEHEGYGDWEVTGTAFGEGPVRAKAMPAYQGDVGAEGERLVNSHNARHGEDVRAADAHTGMLSSPPFTIRRKYITFLLGGGNHPGKTCVDLLVDGKVVRTATGRNANRMQPRSFDVRDLEGKTARLRITDAVTGGWGNVGVDDIRFSDTPREAPVVLEDLPDHGTLCLALLGHGAEIRGCADLEGPPDGKRLFAALHGADERAAAAERAFGAGRPAGGLGRAFRLAPGASETVTFLFAWHFPNARLAGIRGTTRRRYARRFGSARSAVAYAAERFDRLRERTLRWVETWYDATLPYWFLDRTFANTSTLASSTVYRFEDGRFYGWEGVGCCAGTCTHVWHYAQAAAHLFPDLERDLRERVDFGLAFHADTGLIDYRGEFTPGRPAFDGQAGVILRAFREHRMCPDGAFLRRSWPGIRKATEYLMAQDRDGDGILDGAQPNTLDAAWYGKIAWISSLYHAALRAAEEMAREAGDPVFADRARAAYERGRRTLEAALFNGEYFIQVPDPEHLDAIGADSGCYIDQVIGQSWAYQVGLGRLHDEKKVRSALRSLWKYNFAPDVGPFKKIFTRGRPYALAGDGGLIMCTWPKGGKRKGWEKHWQYMYFNECMTGFEYQVAGHMLWEGMLLEGLAVTRAIHDRYHPLLRNPYNEIECSDHYARAMASYGVFLAACGFEYHGPKGHLGFAPRLNPEAFRAAFTAAEGWGTIEQRRDGSRQENGITLRHGRLRLRTLAFEVPEGCSGGRVTVAADGEAVPARTRLEGRRLEVTLLREIVLEEGDRLQVSAA